MPSSNVHVVFCPLSFHSHAPFPPRYSFWSLDDDTPKDRCCFSDNEPEDEQWGTGPHWGLCTERHGLAVPDNLDWNLLRHVVCGTTLSATRVCPNLRVYISVWGRRATGGEPVQLRRAASADMTHSTEVLLESRPARDVNVNRLVTSFATGLELGGRQGTPP